MNQHCIHVLIVSPDQQWAQLLQDTLNNKGFATVNSAHCKERALHLFYQTVPPLVLLDLDLPDDSAVLLCTEMRQSQPAVKIIAINTNENDERLTLLHGHVTSRFNRNLPLTVWPAFLIHILNGKKGFSRHLLGALLHQTRQEQSRQ